MGQKRFRGKSVRAIRRGRRKLREDAMWLWMRRPKISKKRRRNMEIAAEKQLRARTRAVKPLFLDL